LKSSRNATGKIPCPANTRPGSREKAELKYLKYSFSGESQKFLWGNSGYVLEDFGEIELTAESEFAGRTLDSRMSAALQKKFLCLLYPQPTNPLHDVPTGFRLETVT